MQKPEYESIEISFLYNLFSLNTPFSFLDSSSLFSYILSMNDVNILLLSGKYIKDIIDLYELIEKIT